MGTFGSDVEEVLRVDDSFFDALLNADTTELTWIMCDDFVIIDVNTGQITSRPGMLEPLRSGELRFLEIVRDADNRSTRTRNDTVVVIGRTEMKTQLGEETVFAESRYAHVYVNEAGRWRLLVAQGTPVVDPGSADLTTRT